MKTYDVIIVGAGAFGSLLSYHFSRLGARTLTIERFSLNHANGSSHGKTRIIRTAYAESPIYVPLLKRAWTLWYELALEAKEDLIHKTGGLYIGDSDGYLVQGANSSALSHGLNFQLLTRKEIQDKFPVFHLGEEQVGIYESDAGVLFPEKCIEASCNLAIEMGAEFHFAEEVTGFVEDPMADRVVISTNKDQYSARKAVLTCGGWLNSLLYPISLDLKIERQVLFWFEPLTERRELFSEGKMPIFMFEENRNPEVSSAIPDLYYGIPDYGDGVKIGRHHFGQKYDKPEMISRAITIDDEIPIRAFLASRVPDTNGSILSSSTCFYTNTRDGNFLIGELPGYNNIVVVSACSGHGFKFASVIGEVLARKLLGMPASCEITQFDSF